MGRGCSMDEWAHFKKLPDEGRVPNSSYWYVLCRHCVAGFERKQLFNAPAKLTGRRSAMRAHLNSCPIYASQYKMEQIALQEAAAAKGGNDETTTATSAISAGDKRKRKNDGSRGGRGKHCMMEEWTHFTRLQDEGYIGKSNFFYAVCKHCERAYNEAPEDQKSLLVPEKLVGRREKMRKHLSLCPHFKGDLPPLERRLHQGTNGIPPSMMYTALVAGAMTNMGSTLDASAADQSTTGSAAATIPSSGLSRLALDEWHYFTRLGRKKDSAYYYARCNFCQQAFENAPDAMKTSMEPAIVMGRKNNMQTHLAKCLYIPKEASTIAKVYRTGCNTKLDSEVSTASKLDASVSSEPKRPKLDAIIGSSVSSSVRTSVHRALMQIIIQHRLPFEWVESESVKQLFRALIPESEVTDVLMPSTSDLRSCVLEEIYRLTLFSELTKLQGLIPLELATSAFSKNAVDDLPVVPLRPWPAMLHCNLSVDQQHGSIQMPTIEGIVTNGKAIVSLSFIRAQRAEANVDAALACNHGLEVARWLDEHIRLCVVTAKLAIAAVVLPFNSITQRAVGILRAPKRWPQIIFLSDMETMLQFPLLKLLEAVELNTVVSSLIEVWQLESIRACVMERLSKLKGGAHASPFRDWESCAVLIQVLLDNKTFEASTKRGAANAKRLVENALNRSLLERVCNLLHAFANVFSSCRAGLTLSEAMMQLGVLFTAAEGFITVQLALELVWEHMEQPLFVLAHALNPCLRLRDINSTAISKLSTLCDLSVSYFMSLFGHKPKSLRGEVTAYLRTSQRVFTAEFVAEFSDVDDYFRYLNDSYPSLSMLMQVLSSFSSTSPASHTVHPTHHESVGNMYTNDEQLKLDYLRGRWGLASTGASLSESMARETKSRIAAHNDRSGAAMLNTGVVVDEWKKTLEAKLHGRGVEFSLLENKFHSVDEVNISLDATEQEVSDEPNLLQLPKLALDDMLMFPSTGLRADFSIKVSLKDLFKPAEATI